MQRVRHKTSTKTLQAIPQNGKAEKKSKPRKGIGKGEHKNGHVEKALDETYNEFKQFEGQHYTGMAVGRTHKWYYDQGEWKEKKVTPDEWTFTYAVKKRRAGKAPEGSGVPSG